MASHLRTLLLSPSRLSFNLILDDIPGLSPLATGAPRVTGTRWSASHSSSQIQTESFSRRLRRRFSKESKSSRSSSDPRELGKGGFPFSLRPSRSARTNPVIDVATLEEYGSSLMSDRVYDSDAQCITTPRRPDLLRKPPPLAGHGLRRMELSDLIERSQERTSAERWAMSENSAAPASQESAFGMRFIPTPPTSLRGMPISFHTPQGTNEYQGQPSQASERRRHQLALDVKPKLMRSLPSLSSTATEHGRSDIQSVVPSMKQALTSRHGNGVASSGSLSVPSPGFMVPKARNLSSGTRSFTDPDLNGFNELSISKREASPAQSSALISDHPSLAEVIHEVQQGFLMAPSQEHVQIPRGPGNSMTSIPANPALMAGSHNASSCYSRGTIEKDVLFKHDLSGELGDQTPIIDIPDPKPELGQASGSASPRKVSVGWMSGGRRVGYGYSAVPETGSNNRSQDVCYYPQFNRPAGWKAEIELVDPSIQQEPREPSNSRTPVESANNVPYNKSDEDPAVDARYTPSRPNETTTFPSPSDSSQRRAGSPVPPYMRRSLENRTSREQGAPIILTDEATNGGLRAPGLTPMFQVDHCEIPPSHHPSQANGKFARQWARLSQSAKAKSRAQRRNEHHGGRAQDGKPSVDRFDRLDPPDEAELGSIDAELTAEFDNEAEDRSTELQASVSRPGRWVRRFSRHWEGRRFSRYQQEISQSSSGNSYHDCDSTSLKRANSTKSNSPDENCLDMPGSFEGSRWASRLSRFL
ncbi:hypothetical protein N7468_005283 [Penicillium chermesinum]|uniref:Uncharacterized protein n=1 Tax=Penicillium chermesinum TaxID=63820 RepID=A0A9W9TN25_9EURO|nr:uncharacterized protein N7468_005283 [Penicillium chermesinum]KAJ5232327.1 hypothetical protein N7468_005283 [Penicillium chermesinum]